MFKNLLINKQHITWVRSSANPMERDVQIIENFWLWVIFMLASAPTAIVIHTSVIKLQIISII